MDKRQKSALRSTYRQLADELILDEDFYAALKQNKIFTDGMIGMIKREATPRDRVYMLLELLEKRGPKAFDKFVQILMENYDWLADKLTEEYNQRRQTSLLHAHHGCNTRSVPYEHQQSLTCLEFGGARHDHYRFALQPNTPRFYGMCQPSIQYPASASYMDNGQTKFLTYQMPLGSYCGYLGCDSTDHPCQPASTNSCTQSGENTARERNTVGHQNNAVGHPSNAVGHPNNAVCHPRNEVVKASEPKSDDQDQLGKENRRNGKENAPETKHPQQKYKDACISPIEVKESPRKEVSKGDSNSAGAYDKNIDSKVDDEDNLSSENDQGFDEIRSQSTVKHDRHGLKLCNDTNSENNDVLDGPDNISIALETARSEEPKMVNFEAEDNNGSFDDEDDDVFPSSEVFYDYVRRGSSCMSNLQLGVLKITADLPNERIQTQEYEDEDTEFDELMRSDSSSVGPNAEHSERMKRVYFKLVSANTGFDDFEEDGENIVSWEIIDDELDKLINSQQNSEDNKLLKACLEKFPEKERRQPLNVCIENLFLEKKHIQERFNEKSKEIDRMVYDMWNHQQDMKNIEKLKKQREELLAKNERLQASIQSKEILLNEQMLIAAQMELKAQQLEKKHREEGERRAQASTRRGLNLQGNRQQLNRNVQGQSPRRAQAEPKLHHACRKPHPGTKK